jgi:GWxTD domain-containing protein
LPLQYQRWLDDEVQWIVTPEERAAFVRLTDDGKRDKFIEVFWERRNPTPGSAQNEFREEHYRRIAFANAHYAAANPGSKTDRGRMYIMYGPPDEIDSHPAGVSTLGDHYAKPTEFWGYRSIREIAPPKRTMAEGRTELKAQTVGKLNVQMKFVDVCSCGDYRLESPPKN